MAILTESVETIYISTAFYLTYL